MWLDSPLTAKSSPSLLSQPYIRAQLVTAGLHILVLSFKVPVTLYIHNWSGNWRLHLVQKWTTNCRRPFRQSLSNDEWCGYLWARARANDGQLTNININSATRQQENVRFVKYTILNRIFCHLQESWTFDYPKWCSKMLTVLCKVGLRYYIGLKFRSRFSSKTIFHSPLTFDEVTDMNWWSSFSGHGVFTYQLLVIQRTLSLHRRCCRNHTSVHN